MGSLRTLSRNAPQSDFISGSSCTVSELHRQVSRQLAALFGASEDHFLDWQQEQVCIQFEGESNFPALPDISDAESKLMKYAWELTRYRIVRALQIQDCPIDVLFYKLMRIDLRAYYDIGPDFDLTDNEIDWIAKGLKDDGVLECIEGPDSHGNSYCVYSLLTENSLTRRQQQVLQALWGTKNGLSQTLSALDEEFSNGPDSSGGSNKGEWIYSIRPRAVPSRCTLSEGANVASRISKGTIRA